MKRVLLILIILFPLIGFGQNDCSWFRDKVTTSLDSLTIIQEKVKLIKIFKKQNDSLENIHLMAIEIDLTKTIDCNQRVYVSYRKKKIIELYEFNYGSSDWNYNSILLGEYKLIHYLNNKGLITKTERKWKKGVTIEDYDSIEYEYSNNLLVKAKYYTSLYLEHIPYEVIIFEYKY